MTATFEVPFSRPGLAAHVAGEHVLVTASGQERIARIAPVSGRVRERGLHEPASARSATVRGQAVFGAQAAEPASRWPTARRASTNAAVSTRLVGVARKAARKGSKRLVLVRR